jgi:8-oxo-dGTP pyrophosphatase MutT (NUDIX family)
MDDDQTAGRAGPGLGAELAAELDAYQPRTAVEAHDLGRTRELVAGDPGDDPWARTSPLHVTASALVVHPPTARALLRWHERMGTWLQVGGHGDPGESRPFAIAVREAREETGLTDLAPWPDRGAPTLVHVVVVPVPAGGGEPPHEHADLRYLLATDAPDAVVPESAAARLRWVPVDDAGSVATNDNLAVTLSRVAQLLGGGPLSTSS